MLYGPCNMCLENHTPGIQTLTNESSRLKKNGLWAWPRVQTNASAIAAENEQIAIQNERS